MRRNGGKKRKKRSGGKRKRNGKRRNGEVNPQQIKLVYFLHSPHKVFRGVSEINPLSSIHAVTTHHPCSLLKQAFKVT